MAHFLGEVSGSRGKASRLGTKKSGLKTTAASWAGAITVDLDFNELTGKSTFSVWQREWRGKGINGSEPLAEGIIGEPVKKENGINEEMLDALKAIRARLNGEFDHPALVALGPLMTTDADIGTLVQNAITKAEG